MIVDRGLEECLFIEKKGLESDGKWWKVVESEKDRVGYDKISSFVFVDLLVVMPVFIFVQIVNLSIFWVFLFIKKKVVVLNPLFQFMKTKRMIVWRR